MGVKGGSRVSLALLKNKFLQAKYIWESIFVPFQTQYHYFLTYFVAKQAKSRQNPLKPKVQWSLTNWTEDELNWTEHEFQVHWQTWNFQIRVSDRFNPTRTELNRTELFEFVGSPNHAGQWNTMHFPTLSLFLIASSVSEISLSLHNTPPFASRILFFFGICVVCKSQQAQCRFKSSAKRSEERRVGKECPV